MESTRATAVAGSDYVATSGSVTFLAGQTVASVAVDVLGDAANEGLETFSLVVSPTAPIANVNDEPVGAVTIIRIKRRLSAKDYQRALATLSGRFCSTEAAATSKQTFINMVTGSKASTSSCITNALVVSRTVRLSKESSTLIPKQRFPQW